MIIELLDKDKNILTLKGIEEIPTDLTGINSVQVINYSKKDIVVLERLFDIDATILNNSDDIEISSHYLEKEGQLAFSFSFPYFTTQNKIEEIIVSFILTEKKMFSFMDINFEKFISANKKKEHFDKMKNTSFTLDTFLLMMIGVFPDYFADLTEVISKNIKTIYAGLQKENDFSEYRLNEITALKFNNLIVKESLNEFTRILHLLRKSNKLNAEIKKIIFLEISDLTVIN